MSRVDHNVYCNCGKWFSRRIVQKRRDRFAGTEMVVRWESDKLAGLTFQETRRTQIDVGNQNSDEKFSL